MDDFENCLINMKVLESLQSNVRLDTTETLFRIHSTSSWMPAWVKRIWAQQTRLTDITRIQSLYLDARRFVEEQHPQSERIKRYIINSKRVFFVKKWNT